METKGQRFTNSGCKELCKLNLNLVEVNSFVFQTLSAIFNDAVKVFYETLMELDPTEEINVSKLSCEDPQPWEHGNRIISFMKTVRQSFLLYT